MYDEFIENSQNMPEIRTRSNERGKYICLIDKHDEHLNDDDIAEYLGITEEMYQSLLMEYGGIKVYLTDEYWGEGYEIYFPEEIDIINVIKELEEIVTGFLVAKELMK